MRKYSGKELYELQKKHNISEYEIATRTGLSRSAVHGLLYYYKKKHNLLGGDTADTVIREANGELNIRHTSRIQSLEELIEAFSIDTTRWKVKSFIAEKWDSITDGEEKFLIRASFEERKYYDAKPIAPIEITIEKESTVSNTVSNNVSKLNHTLALFDLHFGFRRVLSTGRLIPFHCREAIATALEIATIMQPSTIVFGGDFLDMSEWSSKFTLEPEFYFTTQNALLECSWWIGKFIQRCPSAEVVMLSGNHEDRLRTLVTNRLVGMMALSPVDAKGTPLASIDNLLGLSRMGVKYIDDYPDGSHKVALDTLIEHGVVARAKPGMTAAAVVEQRNMNIVFGHKHTLERASRNVETSRGRKIVTAACGGCLCRTDGAVPGSNKNVQWQNGITEIIHDEKSTYAINQILIESGGAVYNGNLVKGDKNTVAQATAVIRQLY